MTITSGMSGVVTFTNDFSGATDPAFVKSVRP